MSQKSDDPNALQINEGKAPDGKVVCRVCAGALFRLMLSPRRVECDACGYSVSLS